MQSAPPEWSSVWGTSQSLDFDDDTDKQPGQLSESSLLVKVSEWERQIASADQRQAEIQHFQFHLVKDQISTFAKELGTIRKDVDLLRGVVEGQVGPKLRDLKTHADRDAHERDCLGRRVTDLKDLIEQERTAREANRSCLENLENSLRSDVITLQTEFREAMAQFSAQEQQARETDRRGLQAQYEERKVNAESALADVELHFSQAMSEGTELCMSKLSALKEEVSTKMAGFEKKLSSSVADSVARLQNSQDVLMDESRRHTEAITENKMGIAALKDTNAHQDEQMHTFEESLNQDMRERRDQLSKVWLAMDSHTHAVAGSMVQSVGSAMSASPSISPLNPVPSVPGSLRAPICVASQDPATEWRHSLDKALSSWSPPMDPAPWRGAALESPASGILSPTSSRPLRKLIPTSVTVAAPEMSPKPMDPAPWRGAALESPASGTFSPTSSRPLLKMIPTTVTVAAPEMSPKPMDPPPWRGAALESPASGTFSPTSSRPLLKMIPTTVTVAAPEMSPMRRTMSQRTFSGATLSPQSPACHAWPPETGSSIRNPAS